MKKRYYGHGLPGASLDELGGCLIVIEGADGSGRSTLIGTLKPWLEGQGYPVATIGIRRSTLVGEALGEAKKGNMMGRLTMGLYYATDFADQLENQVIPALRAGFVVLADRYIYTLIARERVRGVSLEWLTNLLGMAIVPDIVFYLSVSPQTLIERNLTKNGSLDYWESGMDMGLDPNLYRSFMMYQRRVRAQFIGMRDVYGFQIMNANRPTSAVAKDIQRRLKTLLTQVMPSEAAEKQEEAAAGQPREAKTQDPASGPPGTAA
ncbi:MAG: thymidylate kinase [Nitrospirae bacterium]|nr:thymidylate kinase [Nitrospirota bacterium]